MCIGIHKSALALGLVSTLALGMAGHAAAAPVTSSAPLVKHAAPSEVTTVQYRRYGGHRYYGRRHYGGGAAIAGVAAGIIGLGIAGAVAPRYYYDEPGPYYYEPPVTYYGAPPAYYAPRYYDHRYNDEYDRDRN